MVDSPQPANISYMWNFGSLLGACLGIQIVTGVTLAMHYTPSVDLAFISVEHIMRDVNYGWLIRYLHANTASFFFIFVYLHIGRGLYYGSYKSPRVLLWSIGVIILVLMIVTGFLGYQHSQKLYDVSLMSSFPLLCSERATTHLNKLGIKPLAIWENLHTNGIKDIIYPAIKPFAGVYMIMNLITGDIYVGSAVSGNMPNRFHKHLFGFSGSKLVAAAVLKYGLSNFAFIVIDVLSELITAENNKELLRLEDHYLSTLTPVYNIAPNASNTLGVKHTEKTKTKMRLNYSSERREQIGVLNRGKQLSPSTLIAMQKAALSRVPMSEETRTKISDNSTVANVYSVSLLNRTNGATLIRTLPKVAEFLKCNEKTVRRSLKANGVVKNKWKVKLVNDYSSTFDSRLQNHII